MTEVTPVAEFGKAIRPLFAVSATNISVNFGSYGCPPRAIVAKRAEHAQRIDDNTETFFRATGLSQIADARRAVADLMGVQDHDHIVFVDNAAAAYNTLAASLIHNPAAARDWEKDGEEDISMLMFDRQYPMCKAANAFWNRRACNNQVQQAATGNNSNSYPAAVTSQQYRNGFVRIEHVEATPALEAEMVQSLASRVVEGGFRFFLIDHICWSPAFVFPIAELCKKIRHLERERVVIANNNKQRVVIIIDAAHALGNIDLRPLFAEQQAHMAQSNNLPLFDAYFSNAHKWLMAPKSIAVLYVAPMWHRHIHPPVIGNNFVDHYHSDDKDDKNAASFSVTSAMQREFFCPGTRDHSLSLALVDLIAYRRTVLGGEDRIRQYCFTLAQQAGQRVAEIWNSSVVIPAPATPCTMVSVFCPEGLSTADAIRITTVMLEKYECFGPINELQGRPTVRLSAQVYQELNDFEHYATLFLQTWRSLSDVKDLPSIKAADVVGGAKPRNVLLIGSSSKWRKATLLRHLAPNSSPERTQRFNEFLQLSPDIDEKAIRRDAPQDLCLAIAEAKMDKVLSVLRGEVAAQTPEEEEFQNLYRQTSVAASEGTFWIITGDQVAVYNGTVREKPADRDENVRFLQDYRGSSVQTVAATVIVDVKRNVRKHAVNWTRTSFRSDLPDDVIQRVIDHGDSLQCCGGFVVDDELLIPFIEHVEPSFEAVEGLDINVVLALMEAVAAP